METSNKKQNKISCAKMSKVYMAYSYIVDYVKCF